MTDDGLVDIKEFAERMRDARRMQHATAVIPIVLAAVLAPVLITGLAPPWLAPAAVFIAIASVLLCTASGSLARRYARDLASAESPYAVPELLREMIDPPPTSGVHSPLETMRMLARSVRKMSMAEAARLSAREADTLYRLLHVARVEENAIVQLSILESLRTTKDTRAIEPVRRLALPLEHRAQTNVALQVHEAAAEVLPLLERQKAIEKHAATLVRAAGAEPTELLARPMDRCDAETESLLRSVSQAEDS